jgi:hypothetical protein
MKMRYCSECAKNSLRPRQWPCELHPDATFLDEKMLEEKVSALRTISIAASLRGAVIAVISSPAGLSVAFDDLMVYRLENGNYAVDVDAEKDQRIWKTAHEAVDDFEKVRQEMKLGYEFETTREPPMDTIHFVRMGRTACDFSSEHGVPGNWPRGHLWSSDWSRVDCGGCNRAKSQFRDEKIHDPRR